jgi:hypothetical protein
VTFAFLIIFGVLAYNFKYFEHFYFCLGMSSDENNSLAEEEEVGHERRKSQLSSFLQLSMITERKNRWQLI